MKDAVSTISGLLPILTLLGGWLLGLLSSLLLERMRREQSLQGKLFDQYLKVREEITSAISKIIGQLRPSKNLKREIPNSEHAEEIGRLFFTHYDLLPYEVAIEMVCLYCCLLKEGKHIYRCDGRDRIVPLDLKNTPAVFDFLRGITIMNNFLYYAPNAFKSSDEDIRKDAIIRSQAFSVLAALNKYFSKKRLMSWESFLRKLPMADKTEMRR